MTHVLVLDSWAGRQQIPVEIVESTTKKYRVRLIADTLLPGGRHRKAGDMVLVPKYAVREQKEQEAA